MNQILSPSEADYEIWPVFTVAGCVIACSRAHTMLISQSFPVDQRLKHLGAMGSTTLGLPLAQFSACRVRSPNTRPSTPLN
jgi:hypothetical protein